MKKIFVLATLLLCMFTATAFASSRDSVAKQRQQINELHAKTLEKLYAKYPHANRVIEECYAYATLSNTGVKIFLVGSGHGRGLAINNETGEKVYLHMEELSAGLGFGAKEYDLIFLINTPDAWENSIFKAISLGARNYLVKPQSPETIIQTVNKVLNSEF